MRDKFRIWLVPVFIGGLMVCGQPLAANISVMTDRDPVPLHESFDMIFEADGSVDDDPDFSPLNRDFQVLSTGVSSNMSIINGKISTTKQWRLTLMARRAGILTIPPIAFGSDASQPSSVTVTGKGSPGNQQGNTSNREVFLEVEAIPEQPYVQSQVIYKIRLYRAIATTNAVLSDPSVNGSQAVIERLGDDLTYDTRRLAKRFNVVERTFAIYPQTSGRINIEPVIFQAQAASGVSTFFNSPFTQQLKTVLIQSDPVVLNVKAVPAAFSGSQWLPAQGLELNEEWSQNPPLFRVGEPVTRTLTITARGLMASQLPELPAWSTADIKQYPDQPVLTDDKSGFGITGTRVEKTAYIPNKAGQYIIPGVRIPWWNTQTNTQEYAELPERTITVLQPRTDNDTAGEGLILNPVPMVTPDELKGGSEKKKNIPEVETGKNGSITASRGAEIWQWISLGLLVVWLVTLYVWWYGRHKGRGTNDPENNRESLTKLTNSLKTACQSNDARLARERLLYWGRLMWPQQKIVSISDIGKFSGVDLAGQIRLLNNALYSRSQEQWDGSQFWQVFVEEQKRLQQRSVKNSSKLEPLFRI